MAVRTPNLNHFAINHIVRMYNDKTVTKNFALESLFTYFYKVYYSRMKKHGDDCHLYEMLNYALTHFNPNYRQTGYEGKSRISFVPYFMKLMHDRNLNRFNEIRKSTINNGMLILTPNIDTELVPNGSRRSFAEMMQHDCPTLESLHTQEYDRIFIHFVITTIQSLLTETAMARRIAKVLPTLISHYTMGYSGKEISKLMNIDQVTLSRMKTVIATILPSVLEIWDDEVNNRQSRTCSSERTNGIAV